MQKIDIALISAQYKNIDGYSWTSDGSNKSAIWTMGHIKPQSKMMTAKHGFTWVKTKGIYFFSCYAPPSLTAEEYERMLTALAFEARGKHPVLIAGDFNAWSTTWGSTRTSRRGRVLLESLAPFDLELLNVPGKFTFQTERGCSIVDPAFANSTIVRNATWTVSSTYTYSDHKAITIDILMGVENSDFRPQRAQKRGWKRQSFDPEVFNMSWNACLTLDSAGELKAEGMTAVVSNCLSKACDGTMPRLSGRPHRKAVYWWNSHIAKIRGDCNRVRRKLKRACGTPAVDALLAQHKTCKATLKKAIQANKNRCFKELCDSVNVDPWGKGHKVVMRTVKNPRGPQPTCPALLRVVVSTLFPY
ncbi:uncharacterized protein LOC128869821 [Anastrepha ludens]|uniref:uncharacterized protein LOC128869821 n=1 Tax=Anastrepha ludens TaxID=28586 RepID=UPI0023B116F7|nr:uncharacterized protein LOC128869821 [Anastrepha ludens]